MSRLAALSAVALTIFAATAGAAPQVQTHEQLDAAIDSVVPKVIEWRHDIHEHPELGNREFRTAAKVADHLRALGFDEVQTEVAHTGVVGILRGGHPGGVVALRADMDALPVLEQTGLPFASEAIGEYNGEEVPVMHACGHDAHVAILMGAAEVLAGMRAEIPGTIKFIFQPAEEGPPEGEEGGAALMIKEGVLESPAPEAIFGLHVFPGPPGLVGYRPEGALAAADELRITVRGTQTHGSMPWGGVDPVIVSAQIMTALQLIPSRQLNVTQAPAVISIGSIHGGIRGNIIPDEVEMTGTIRTFDENMREDILDRIRNTATQIATSSGATADVSFRPYAPVTYNDPELTARMVPTLEWAAGADRTYLMGRVMGAEDFAHYVRHVPGLYVALSVSEADASPQEMASNHSPFFYVNDDAMRPGVRTMVGLALDYLGGR
ncbi:MAG: amidohydrolase [Acidobacteria bacterium]|nr:amidohydrolase [Acidobacteriota bacterium]